MKLLTIFTLCFIVLTGLLAQDTNEHPWYISAAIGPSFPIDSYKENGVNDINPGMALNGVNFNASFNYYIQKNIGFGILLLNTTNQYDSESLKNNFSLVYPNSRWSVTAGSYRSSAAMAGISGGFMSGRVNWEFRGYWGYAFSQYPEITSTATYGAETTTYTQNQAESDAFAHSLGIGIRLNINQQITLNANADRYSTRPNFNLLVVTSDGEQSQRYINQDIVMWNLSFGVGYKF